MKLFDNIATELLGHKGKKKIEAGEREVQRILQTPSLSASANTIAVADSQAAQSQPPVVTQQFERDAVYFWDGTAMRPAKGQRMSPAVKKHVKKWFFQPDLIGHIYTIRGAEIFFQGIKPIRAKMDKMGVPFWEIGKHKITPIGFDRIKPDNTLPLIYLGNGEYVPLKIECSLIENGGTNTRTVHMNPLFDPRLLMEHHIFMAETREIYREEKSALMQILGNVAPIIIALSLIIVFFGWGMYISPIVDKFLAGVNRLGEIVDRLQSNGTAPRPIGWITIIVMGLQMLI